MPPNVRLPAVKFRSLLLPPLRAHLTTLHDSARPGCASVSPHRITAAPCVVQRRSLYLYKTATAKTALGMHKVLDFELYTPAPPSASKHTVNLVESPERLTVVEKDVSLQTLYDDHVSPGNFLYMAVPLDKKVAGSFDLMRERDIPSTARLYTVTGYKRVFEGKKRAEKFSKWLTPHEHHGPLKTIHLTLSSPAAYQKLVLSRAYQFIGNGSPVEVCIRWSPPANSKTTRGTDPDLPAYMDEHFPHLRPDFILKSMPEGTVYVVQPVSDGRCLQWVMGNQAVHQDKNLTNRLLKVKGAVEKSLDDNQMARNYLERQKKRQGLPYTKVPKALPGEVKLEKTGEKGPLTLEKSGSWSRKSVPGTQPVKKSGTTTDWTNRTQLSIVRKVQAFDPQDSLGKGKKRAKFNWQTRGKTS
ncbi:hypothetical protein C7974DRAFT_386091, partial [Boeremia exigua]|uniref:uncharacterized protein n=1 Tax=Boeremia exigua TaxID=749465 RepID=UPI001E8E91CC